MLSFIDVSQAPSIDPVVTISSVKDEKEISESQAETENQVFAGLNTRKILLTCGDDQLNIINTLSREYQLLLPSFRVGSKLYFYETFSRCSTVYPSADIILIVPVFKDKKIQNATQLADEIKKLPRKAPSYYFLVTPLECQFTQIERNQIASVLSIPSYSLIQTTLLDRGSCDADDHTSIVWRFNQARYRKAYESVRQKLIDDIMRECVRLDAMHKAKIMKMRLRIFSPSAVKPSGRMLPPLVAPKAVALTQRPLPSISEKLQGSLPSLTRKTI